MNGSDLWILWLVSDVERNEDEGDDRLVTRRLDGDSRETNDESDGSLIMNDEVDIGLVDNDRFVDDWSDLFVDSSRLLVTDCERSLMAWEDPAYWSGSNNKGNEYKDGFLLEDEEETSDRLDCVFSRADASFGSVRIVFGTYRVDGRVSFEFTSCINGRSNEFIADLSMSCLFERWFTGNCCFKVSFAWYDTGMR
jgi:hypothetical protein